MRIEVVHWWLFTLYLIVGYRPCICQNVSGLLGVNLWHPAWCACAKTRTRCWVPAPLQPDYGLNLNTPLQHHKSLSVV
jgi:hypothetical protein